MNSLVFNSIVPYGALHSSYQYATKPKKIPNHTPMHYQTGLGT
jgi:hypothetical protein